MSAATTTLTALDPFFDGGGDMSDVDGLTAYAETLGKSRRANLRSAIALWAKETCTRLQLAATTENVLKTQADLMRLEALPKQIKAEMPKGTKIHFLQQSG